MRIFLQIWLLRPLFLTKHPCYRGTYFDLINHDIYVGYAKFTAFYYLLDAIHQYMISLTYSPKP